MSYLTLVPARTFDAAPVNWADADETHRTVMRLFPDGLASSTGSDKRATAGILFRVEHGNNPALLIRSDVKPARLPAQAVCREIPSSLAPPAGTRVRFRCTLNAVHQSSSRGGGRSPVDDVPAWFANRAASALADVDVVGSATRVVQQADAVVRLTTLDGFATVVGPTALDDLMRVGIGRAKAYGAGLLTIALA